MPTAIDAWSAARDNEPDRDWAEEAGRRRQRLLRRQPVSVDLQVVRERIEDELLPQWAEDLGKDTSAAARALGEAEQLATSLVRAGADGMAAGEITRIRALEANGDAARLRRVADGFVLYAGARRAYLADQQQKAAGLMRSAATEFRAGGSPYALWEPVYRSIYLRNEGSLDRAIGALDEIDLAAIPQAFRSLLGRADWARSVAISASGDFSTARGFLERAKEQYRQAQEVDNLAATETFLAEADWVLGNRARGWTGVREVLEILDARPSSRRNFHLTIAGHLAAAAGLTEAVLEFETARIASTTRQRSLAEAYLNRARIWARLNAEAQALEDLQAAERAAASLEDPALRRRNTTDIAIVKAQLLAERDPKATLALADEAMSYVGHAAPAVGSRRCCCCRTRVKDRLR